MRYTKTQELTAVEKAKRAVSAFRRLQPTLNAYARNLTGRPDIRIEVAAQDNGSTDGKRIYFRPPIELGEELNHNRSQCNQRGEDLQLLCAACASREKVLGTIYHEIAHIWFDSFAGVSDYNRKLALEQVIKERPGKYADEIRKRLAYESTFSYMQLAQVVNEFFPFLINCLEDARVNRELFKALPGTEIMFHANAACIFSEGVEQMVDGEWQKKEWRDYPLNAQSLLGTFCIASGYDYSGWFAPVVEAALRDTQLTALVDEAAHQYSVGDIFKAAFPILTRLRELGFCKSEYEPEDEPTPPAEPESQDDQDEDGEEGDDESKAEESADQPGDSEPDEATSSSTGDEDGDSQAQPDQGDDDNREGDQSSGGGEGEADSSDVPEGHSVDDSDADESVGVGSGDSCGEGSDDGDPDDQEGVCDSDQIREPSDVEDEQADRGDAGSDDGDQDEDAGVDAASGDDETGQRGNATESPDSDGDLDGADSEPRSEADLGTPDGSRDSAEGDEEPSGDELIDTGDYEQGTKIKAVDTDDELEILDGSDLPMGTPEEVQVALVKLGDHEEKPDTVAGLARLEDDMLERIIIQGVYFETPSTEVAGVKEYSFEGDRGPAWDYENDPSAYRLGASGDFSASESVVGPATLKARVAFSMNARAAYAINEKKGKIRPSALARRAPVDDPRMFGRKTLPGKKSYFVVLGIDVSYSTAGTKIALAKKLAMTEAEILHRVGVNFEIWAHSCGYSGEAGGLVMNMYPIKTADEAWGMKSQARMAALGPDSGNLDGHAAEFFRKRLDLRKETTKILHFVTDGAMPASNHDEELIVLQREIAICKRKGYIFTGIGIETDSPIRHGLETIEIKEDRDIELVIRNLGEKIGKL